jgi:phage recombination protein Bet
MSNETQSLVKKPESSMMEYVPFGARDPIKLSISIVKSLWTIKTKSGQTCSDRDALKFMALCQAQLLNPATGDCFLVGYDKRNQDGSYTPVFSMITAHQAYLKRAEPSPDFEGMESGIILQTAEGQVTEREGDFKLPEEKVVGGWAKVYRKGRKVTYRRLSIAAMKPAYETPFWGPDKAPGQIVKCAEADALRSTFPTLLGGLPHAGEMIDVTATVTSAAIPQSALVDVRPADGQDRQIEQGETQEQAAPRESAPPASNGANAELEKLITEAGFTFNHFQIWAKETSQLENADSLPSFNEVPEAVAKRLLRAKTGLLKGLADVKGAA